MQKSSFLYFHFRFNEGDEMGAKNVTAARQKRKQELVYIMGGKCSLCGYDKCIAALEFHHIDKKQKERQLSSGNCHSWEEDIQEVKKCALVCSNCHKEIEFFKLNVETTFDEEKYNEITAQKENAINHCKKCGIEIDRKAYYCVECWRILSRKVERPSREELKQLIRNNTFADLSRIFDVSDNSIKKWCQQYQLPHKVSDIKLISDEDWELI